MTIFTPRPQWIVDLINELAGTGGGTWGSITGTLSNQTDLQAALDAKVDDSQISTFGATLIDDADAATARTTLGLGSAATLSTSDIDERARDAVGTALVAGSNITITPNDGADTITIAASASGPGTGSGSFGLITSWTYSTNVPNVDFVDLEGYSDLLIVCRGITHSVSSQISIRLSTDNGSSFFSGASDYAAIPATGVEALTNTAALNSANATLARTGIGTILGINLNGVAKVIDRMSRDDAGPILFVGSTSPVNALRVHPNGGGNITGGSIFLFGR